MFKAPILEDLKQANRTISKLSSEPTKVIFPKLGQNLRLIVFSDAAFRNLPVGISSGRGHIVFLSDDQNKVSPLGWNSNKVKRVVGSTIAAEGLSLQKAIDHSYFLRAILAGILNIDQLKIPITSYIDSRNLYDAVFSTKMVEDKKLRCDIAQIAESLEKEKVVLKWIPGQQMVADCLTKRGANCLNLMNIMKTGSMPSVEQ